MPDYEISIKIDPKEAMDPAQFRMGLQRAVRRIGLHLEGAAKDNVTPFTRTGRLRSSITHTVSADALSTTIGTRTFYARFVEEGTRPHEIRPRNKKALAWPKTGKTPAGLGRGPQGTFKSSGTLQFAKVVHHPGFKGHFYMRRALQESKDDLGRIVAQELAKALRG
jgi:HK97 gp10 family phage protein